MINWIINKFGDKTDDSSELSAKGRTRIGQAASVMCIICNVVLCAAKGGIGLAVGSISIVADALNNLSDASSNVISLLGFRFASKPADEHHPLGHGRYEYLASLAVAVLICILGTQLARESVEKIFSPEPAEFSTAAVVVLVLSMLVKLWMSYFNGKLGKMIDSDTLRATAVDSRNDVITTALILASSVFMQLTGINIDGWVGLGMGAFITIGGIQLLRETVSPLLGSAPDKAFVDKAFSMIIAYPGILDTYDLMAHDYGPGRLFVSASVQMDGRADSFTTHEIVDKIERDFEKKLGAHLILHIDPVDPSDDYPQSWLNHQAYFVDPALNVHNLRVYDDTVAFDVVKHEECQLSDDEIIDEMTKIAAERWPGLTCTVKLDRGYLERVD